MSGKFCLKEFTLPELEAWVQESGQPAYRARQLYRWLYVRGAEDFDKMTDLAKTFRAWLRQRAQVAAARLLSVEQGADGTRKLLLELADGERIESVLIPEGRRLTLCVSSQVGCAFRCRFCVTGQDGWRRNLSAGEIVDQVCVAARLLGEQDRLTNLVFMGMGEPLANFAAVTRALEILTASGGFNFSPRRITVSTVGLLPELMELCRRVPVQIAVSLHASDDATRSHLIPANKRHPLAELLEVCRRLPLPRRQRITMEYVLLDGVNDSAADARRLARLLRGLKVKINLIAFNEHPLLPFRRPPPERIGAFQEILVGAGYTATRRQSRGTDIAAACGQLRHGHSQQAAMAGNGDRGRPDA